MLNTKGNQRPGSLFKFLLAGLILIADVHFIFHLGPIYLPAIVLFFLLVLIYRNWSLLHLTLLLAWAEVARIIMPRYLQRLILNPFDPAIVASTLIVASFSAPRATLNWARWGKMDRISMKLLILTSMISIVALLAWANWTDNLGLGLMIAAKFAKFPRWMVFSAVVPIFALFNSVFEEIAFRGVMQEALKRTFQSFAPTLLLQASAFAAIHYTAGFPNGFIGILMVFVYALSLGYLRERTGGLLAPVLAHFAADLTIFYWLAVRLL